MRPYKLLGGSICSLQSMPPPVSYKWFDNRKLYGEAPPILGKLPGAINLVGYHVAEGAP